MSRRAILITLWIVMLLGALVVGYGGYRYYTRNRVAVGTYRLNLPAEASVYQVIESEKKLMGSDDILKPVIAELDLTSHWGHSSESESLVHMRKSLKLQEGGERGMLRVIYIDRNQEMALAILKSISERYVESKKQQQLLYGPLK